MTSASAASARSRWWSGEDGSIARRRHQVCARSARRAGIRLGVEAAVERALVLRAAGAAHLETVHGRERAVVWDAAHDREARPAVGAVDERVAVAPVVGVEELG